MANVTSRALTIALLVFASVSFFELGQAQNRDQSGGGSEPKVSETSPPAGMNVTTVPAAGTNPQSADQGTPGSAPRSLTFSSWGGAYQQSQVKAFVEPFRKETGVTVDAVARPDGLPALRDALQSGQAAADVIDVPADFAVKACSDGLLEPLDATSLLGADVGKDFIPGAVSECAIASAVWSTVFLYDTRAFIERRVPQTITDVFNVPYFPGKRAFPKQPQYTLEFALMADQVPASQVYKVLSTPAGLTRSFTKLGRIKPQIVWYTKPAEAIDLLAEKKAAFALSYSARAFFSIVSERKTVAILWNGQIAHLNVLAIPKKSNHLDDAKAFIKFVVEPRRLAQQTRWFPYGPPRLSSAAFVSKHADVNMDMAPYLPTTPANFRNVLMFDASFWAANADALAQRFADWADDKVDASGAVPPPKPDPASAKPRKTRG